jgi:hypothetical protein
MPMRIRCLWITGPIDASDACPSRQAEHLYRTDGARLSGVSADDLAPRSHARCVGDRASPDRLKDHAARRNRRLSRSSLARPNIWRLSIFRRLMWPSTGPLLQGSLRPALTAS